LLVWTTCGNAITAVFARAGLPVHAGALLYTWFLDAGLPVPECRLEFLVEGGEDSLYYEWIAETMRGGVWGSYSRIPLTSINFGKSCNGRPWPCDGQ
jgi:hypothetical protein